MAGAWRPSERCHREWRIHKARCSVEAPRAAGAGASLSHADLPPSHQTRPGRPSVAACSQYWLEPLVEPRGSADDPAMSDLEFQRALSSDQMREALSLLDGAARVKLRTARVEDLNPADEVDSGADQASTTTVTTNCFPAAEDAQQRRKQLNVVPAFYGLGIAAAAALTLLSWSERALTPPAPLGVAGEQLPDPQPAQLVKSASPELPVANPRSDRSSHGSEQLRPKPEVAAATPVDQANSGDDQAAAKGATNRASSISHTGQTATVTAFAASSHWWDERASRKPQEGWWRMSAVRGAAARKRFWRRHWQPLAEMNGQCFNAACPPWQKQRAFYEPPRTVTQ